MTTKPDGGPAFPYSALVPDERTHTLTGSMYADNEGMSVRTYAAIHLLVADSGIPWLNETITTAKRDDLAKATMQSILSTPETFEVSGAAEIALLGYQMADAMLAEVRKK